MTDKIYTLREEIEDYLSSYKHISEEDLDAQILFMTDNNISTTHPIPRAPYYAVLANKKVIGLSFSRFIMGTDTVPFFSHYYFFKRIYNPLYNSTAIDMDTWERINTWCVSNGDTNWLLLDGYDPVMKYGQDLQYLLCTDSEEVIMQFVLAKDGIFNG